MKYVLYLLWKKLIASYNNKKIVYETVSRMERFICSAKSRLVSDTNISLQKYQLQHITLEYIFVPSFVFIKRMSLKVNLIVPWTHFTLTNLMHLVINLQRHFLYMRGNYDTLSILFLRKKLNFLYVSTIISLNIEVIFPLASPIRNGAQGNSLCLFWTQSW